MVSSFRRCSFSSLLFSIHLCRGLRKKLEENGGAKKTLVGKVGVGCLGWWVRWGGHYKKKRTQVLTVYVS